jgi:hypothetical protein
MSRESYGSQNGRTYTESMEDLASCTNHFPLTVDEIAMVLFELYPVLSQCFDYL